MLCVRATRSSVGKVHEGGELGLEGGERSRPRRIFPEGTLGLLCTGDDRNVFGAFSRVSGTTIIGMMNVACRRIVDLRSQRSAVNGMQSNDIEEHLPPALPPPALPPPALPVGHEGQVSAREWRRKGEAPLSKGRPLFLPCMLRDASSCLSVGRSRVWVCPRHVEPLFVPIPIETSPVPNRTSHRVSHRIYRFPIAILAQDRGRCKKSRGDLI